MTRIRRSLNVPFMRAYFLSDIHIKDQGEPRAELLVSLIHSLIELRGSSQESVTHLFLLGDIFDLWVADHEYFESKHTPLVDALRELRKLGVDCYYFEGNHDFHLKAFWQEKMGFHVFADDARLKLGPYDVAIEHGDMINPNETGYRLLRWFWRSSFIKFAAHRVPGSWVGAVGENSSKASRARSSKVRTVNRDEILGHMHRHAEKVFSEKPYDFLFAGHTHVLDRFRIADVKENQKRGESINLGSWFEEPNMGILSDEGFEFVVVREWIKLPLLSRGV